MDIRFLGSSPAQPYDLRHVFQPLRVCPASGGSGSVFGRPPLEAQPRLEESTNRYKEGYLAQAPHVVRIVIHAHTGAMSSGLWLNVLLWLLSHATKASMALNDLQVQAKDKQAQSCAPFGGYREKRTDTGSCAFWRPHGGTDGYREEPAFLMWGSPLPHS